MWLLDVNLPNGLVTFLHRQGVSCDTAVNRGWRGLTNGSLTQVAFQAGFRVILTRDRLFGYSAGSSLKLLPDFAIILVTLPQARAAAYLAEFEARWRHTPITPAAGQIIEWP
ncbi:MAG: DUF5615 family PIN-like protein [Deltaproteobacteria bacterium]|nr:DUF5615 family PIN-like protein [Deltaproteobacteria bacterium]MBI3389450.1 DUF5615 family PIN-like protein [Deltaproteobacteria bacterium]